MTVIQKYNEYKSYTKTQREYLSRNTSSIIISLLFICVMFLMLISGHLINPNKLSDSVLLVLVIIAACLLTFLHLIIERKLLKHFNEENLELKK
jgi:ABC-type bacteriocin/lantibiotic exporter with double-glycine peptidase domain